MQKANVKQQQIKELVAASFKFLKEAPSKLEIQCKKACIFHNGLSDQGW